MQHCRIHTKIHKESTTTARNARSVTTWVMWLAWVPRAVLTTGGGVDRYQMVSATIERLVLGCIQADFASKYKILVVNTR